MNRQARIRREIARRFRLRGKCEDDPQAQALVLEACRHDPKRWINDWAWTYDPRNAAKGLPVHLPLKLYPRQAELVDWTRARRQAGENGAVEKARGVGATYVEAALSVWWWLFEDAVSVKWGSRTEADVDQKGNPDSIFEKIRTVLYRLPSWMRPDGFDEDDHDNQKRLLNTDTGANIIGQQGSNMGRGGRSSIYLWDESAFHEHPRAVERSVKENTDCLIEISTHAGTGTPFARKVETRTVEVFEMPWHCVPWRGQQWYEDKESEYAHDPIGFARNVDMDPGGSEERVVIPKKYVDAAVEIDLAPEGPPTAGLDIGESHDLNAYVTRRGPVAERVASWGDTDTTQTARRAHDEATSDSVEELFFDAIGIGAGVAGEFKNFERETDDETLLGEEALGFAFHGVNVGEEPTRQYWPNDKRSDEWLANLKTELWWRLRERFRKTYERLRDDEIDHPDDECISIPDHGDLRAQLSWPLYEYGQGGKYRIESKERTKDRLETHQSYDFADALVLAYAGDVIETGSNLII